MLRLSKHELRVFQHPAGLGAALIAGLLLAFCACRDFGPSTTLRPVPLPALDRFPEAVREQLQSAYRNAFSTITQDESKGTRSGEAYGRLGQLFLAYDLRLAARPALVNAQSLLPQDRRWPYYLGHLYRLDNQPEEAAVYYERVALLQPDDVPTRVRLAQMYRQLGRDAEAEKHLREALRRDNSCALAHFLLGRIAARKGEPRAAIEHYEAALKLQPAATSVHHVLAAAYRRLGQEKRRRAHLAQRGTAKIRLQEPLIDALERLKQGAGIDMSRGSRLMRAGRIAEAAEVFEHAAAANALDAQAYLNLGAARAELGEEERAISALQQALRLDPENSKAHYNLAVLLARRGQTVRARESFRAAVAGDPHNTQAQYALAELLRKGGRCGEAVAHYEQVLAEASASVEARLHLALCRLRLGEYAAAKTLVEAGLEAFSSHPGLLDMLARILATSPEKSVRDGPRALELAERLVSIQQRPETIETLAMAYAAVGRYSEAVRWQEKAIRAAEPQRQAVFSEHLSGNLRLYEQHQPCRRPFPDFVYTM